MDLHDSPSLNRLLASVPEGVAVPSGWLTAQGFSRQLLHKYVRGGWLVPLGRGVYARPGSTVGWQGVVLGLQHLAQYRFHVGGLSALNRLGHAHFLPLGGEPRIHLWGTERVPAWARAVPLDESLVFHTRALFDERAAATGLTQQDTGVRDWTLTMAGAERAVMEMMAGVDQSRASFEHVAEVFETLNVMRPTVISELLAACRSIKVKRLFLFLAHHYRHAWVDRLDTQGVDLGRGKRQIVAGGRLDKDFQITVPEGFGDEWG